MKIKPSQEKPEITVVADNYQEANLVLKLLTKVQNVVTSKGEDRWDKLGDLRDMLEEL